MAEESKEATGPLTLRLFGAFTVERNGKPLPNVHRREGKRLLAYLVLHHGEEVTYRALAERFFPAETRALITGSQDFPSTRQAIRSLRLALGPDAERLQSPRKGVVRLYLTGADVDLWEFDRLTASPDPNDWRQAIALCREKPLLLDWSESWVVSARKKRERDYERLCQQLEQGFAPQTRDNLPQSLTSFIGREAEIAYVRERLMSHRLLTLTGSGGCGKTRLALQVATGLRDSFPDGVWFVELAALADPNRVVQAVATTLQIKEQSNQPLTHTLIAALQYRHILLLLDNCEHLLEASAQLADALLRSCPQLRLLVTSREPLGIVGEQTFRIPSLSYPNPEQMHSLDALQQFEAVRLFAERAPLSRPNFALTEVNGHAVGQLCCRLDGIPLAIELAATRVRALSVEEIVSHLNQRFRLLVRGDRVALPRHQTLRAMIDWSYDLLSEQERVALARLSVFAGGWQIEAAEQICCGGNIESWEILDILLSLVDKSLVVVEESKGQTRYRLLETVRQYAAEKLDVSGEAEQTRNAHRDWYLEFAEEADTHLEGSEQVASLNRLDIEHDNLYAALAWCDAAANGAEAQLRLAASLYRFWDFRSHLSEGREQLKKALEREEARMPTPVRANALAGVGSLSYLHSDLTASRFAYRESLALYQELGNRAGIARVLNDMACPTYMQGDYEEAFALLEESLALRRELEDRQGIATTLGNLGVLLQSRGELPRASQYLTEALSLRRALGNSHGVAITLGDLGDIAFKQGDYERVKELYEESLAIFRDLGERRSSANMLRKNGRLALQQGNSAEARRLLAESLTLFQEFGGGTGVAPTLELFATTLRIQGDTSRAVRLWAATDALREITGHRRPPSEQKEFESRIADARTTLGDEEFMIAWEAGRTLTLNQTLSYALECGTTKHE